MKKYILSIFITVLLMVTLLSCTKKISNNVKAVARELKQANVVPNLSTILSRDAIEALAQSEVNPSIKSNVVKLSSRGDDYLLEPSIYDVSKKGEGGYLEELDYLQNAVESLALEAKNKINNEVPYVPVLGQWVESKDYFYACNKWYFRLDKEDDRITYTSYIDMAYGDYPKGNFRLYRISVTNKDDKEVIEYQELIYDNREGNDKGLVIYETSFYYIEGEEFYFATTNYDRREGNRDIGHVVGLKKSVVDGKIVFDYAMVGYDGVIPKYPESGYEDKYPTEPGKEDGRPKPSLTITNLISGNENDGFVVIKDYEVYFYYNNEAIFNAPTSNYPVIGIKPSYLNSDYADVVLAPATLENFENQLFRFSPAHISSYKYKGETIRAHYNMTNRFIPFVDVPMEELESHIADSAQGYAQTFMDILNNGTNVVGKRIFLPEAFEGKEPEVGYHLIKDFLYKEKFQNLYTIEEAKAIPQEFGNTVERSKYEENVTIYDLTDIYLYYNYYPNGTFEYSTSLAYELSGEDYRLVAGYINVLNNIEYPIIIHNVPKARKEGNHYSFTYDQKEVYDKVYNLPLGSYTSVVWYEKKIDDEWVRVTPYVINESNPVLNLSKKGNEIRHFTGNTFAKGAYLLEVYDILKQSPLPSQN